MRNKTAIFLLAALAAVVAAPSARAGGVVIHIGASFGPRLPAVCAPRVYAAPIVTCAPVAPVCYAPAPVVYAPPVYVAPPPVAYAAPYYYVPPSARFGYGYGLFGRPRYCGWY